MTITLTPTVATALAVVYVLYVFYTHRGLLYAINSSRARVLFSAVLLLEVAVIVGSRFVTPPALRIVLDRPSALYSIADFVVFILVLVGATIIGGRLRTAIFLKDIQSSRDGQPI